MLHKCKVCHDKISKTPMIIYDKNLHYDMVIVFFIPVSHNDINKDDNRESKKSLR